MKRNIRRLWPLVSIGMLVVLTIAAATGSGLEAASSKSPASARQPVPASTPLGGTRQTVPTTPTAIGVPACLGTHCPPPSWISPPYGVPTTTATPTHPPVRSVPAASPLGCEGSSSAGSSAVVLNPDAREGLATVLVPTRPVPPVTVTICRYAGLNQSVRSGDLERSRVLRGSQLAALVGYIDEPSWESVSPTQSYNCPMSIGSIDILHFGYTTGPDVTLSVDIGGCPFVSNGFKTIWGGSIGQRLAVYVGSDAFPG